MEAHTFAFPTDFRGEVRLFPLSELVLFPGIVLPLHIFESRYKEMLEDALAGDELVTMATLMAGFEHDYYSRPPISPIVCIGRVLSHEKTPHGTYNLTLAGLERARIQHEIEPVRSYRRAKVCTLGGVCSPADETGNRQAVKLAEEMLKILPAARPVVEKLLKHGALHALTDFVSFHLPLGIELKLRLLAEPDPGVRAELLLGWLSTVNSATGGRRQRRVDFSDN
jgi:ATP-dependent Lon protease